MKKTIIVALCSTAAVGAALPAFADHTLAGYFRVTGAAEMMNTDGQEKDQKATRFVDQRFRARWQNTLNEYVGVVWFGEVNLPWGEFGAKNASDKGALGNGGKQGADGINVQTKHAFLDLKMPGAPLGASTRIGMQAFNDNFYGLVLDDDVAGVRFDGKAEMVSATVGWWKLDEGAGALSSVSTREDSRRGADDSDLFSVQAAIEPLKGLKIMPEFWYAVNQGLASNTKDSTKEYYLGVAGAYKVDMIDVSGFVLYDGGTKENGVGKSNTDISAWAATVNASADLANVGLKPGLRLMYFSKDNSSKDRKSFSPPNGSNGAHEFWDENLFIFLCDHWAMNESPAVGGGRHALTEAAYAGYGLFGTVLKANYTPPAMKQFYTRVGLGFFMALDDSRNGEAKASREGKNLGTEIAVMPGYKVADGKVDISLRAAYAMLGDFYDKKNAQKKDPDNLYKVALMLNVPY